MRLQDNRLNLRLKKKIENTEAFAIMLNFKELAYRKALPMRLDSDRLRAINLFVRGKEEKDFDLPVRYISEAALPNGTTIT